MKYSQVCFFAILATALRPAESSTKAAFVATPIAAVIPHKASYIAPYDDTYDISHVSAYSGAYAAARQYGYASPYNYKSNSVRDHHYSAEQQYSPYYLLENFPRFCCPYATQYPSITRFAFNQPYASTYHDRPFNNA